MKKFMKLLPYMFVLFSILFAMSACGMAHDESGKTAPTASTAPAASTAAEIVVEAEYSGYVIDQKCGLAKMEDMKMDMDGADIAKNPEKHTNQCNLMEECSKDGYGISIKQEDGSYKYFKFDENGSKLAKEQIVEKTSKKDNLLVDVKGKIAGDTITISSIIEKKDITFAARPPSFIKRSVTNKYVLLQTYFNRNGKVGFVLFYDGFVLFQSIISPDYL
jgi:hypothetical protein